MKMNLQLIEKMRIPIVLTLAVGELIGGFHFYYQREFITYAVYSSEALLFSFLLLSVGKIMRRGVAKFDILIAVICSVAVFEFSRLAIQEWEQGKHTDALNTTIATVFMLATIIVKMLFTVPGRIARSAVASLLFCIAAIAVGTYVVRYRIQLASAFAFVAFYFLARGVSLSIDHKRKSSIETPSLVKITKTGDPA